MQVPTLAPVSLKNQADSGKNSNYQMKTEEFYYND